MAAAEIEKRNEFLDEVCKYMRTWNTYASAAANDVISLDKTCNEPHADFKKQLKMFYRAFDPLHREWLEHFFAQFPFDRDYVKILLECHYFKLLTKVKNVFICLLYTCSFTYSVLQYCERRKLDNMSNQIRVILEEEFLLNQRRFNSEGGWIGLRKFCSTPQLGQLLKFIRLVYCERAILHTFVYTKQFFNDFGLHGRETLDMLMNNVGSFEIAVREAFEKEINEDLINKKEFDSCFAELREDLQNGPLLNYLTKDRDTIALDPTSPLTRI